MVRQGFDYAFGDACSLAICVLSLARAGGQQVPRSKGRELESAGGLFERRTEHDEGFAAGTKVGE